MFFTATASYSCWSKSSIANHANYYRIDPFISNRYALRCLHHLSRCPAFFQHRCIILGVEPLIRVIPQLLESNASNQGGGLVAAYAVHLLSDMLAKYEGHRRIISQCSSCFIRQFPDVWARAVIGLTLEVSL